MSEPDIIKLREVVSDLEQVIDELKRGIYKTISVSTSIGVEERRISPYMTVSYQKNKRVILKLVRFDNGN